MKDNKFKKKIKEMYDENFKLEGIWAHYIIHPELQGEEEWNNYVLKEVWYNGYFHARRQYILQMMKQIKKNKTLKDWEKYAREFVHGFDDNGYVEMIKPNKENDKY